LEKSRRLKKGNFLMKRTTVLLRDNQMQQGKKALKREKGGFRQDYSPWKACARGGGKEKGC